MRIKASSPKGLEVQAVAGLYVVLLGFNMKKGDTKGLLGFAIERTDHTENERYWLKGFKTFQDTDPGLPAGSLVSLLEHPVQAFQWGDYTAKPDHKYTYRIVALKGKPKKLDIFDEVAVEVETRNEKSDTHTVFFNRGVAGSQAFIRKFGKITDLDRVSDNNPVWKWLSRGVEEGIIDFIDSAWGSRFALRAAFYEFHYQPVLNAFKRAADSGADVRIVVDKKDNTEAYPKVKNEEAVQEAGLGDFVIGRETNKSYIAHNKFIVLLKNGDPVAVLTGSTNITEGGIFGHSNVVHIVRDRETAQKYLEYWDQLSNDPPAKELKIENENITVTPSVSPLKLPKRDSISAYFSPRKDLSLLEWYAQLMSDSEKPIFMTAAFGLNDLFEEAFSEDKDYLRYVLLEKPDDHMDVITRDPDTHIAVGSKLNDNACGRWVQERLTSLNNHVKYIHTKYMLIDPLGSDPIIITGSANFSDASTTKNDENMLVIRGNERVADIYLGEFMRLFQHFYFRQFVAKGKDAKKNSRYLDDTDNWVKPYYQSENPKFKERKYFC